MNKLLLNSAIRLAMGGLAFFLAQKGFDSATIETVNSAVLSVLGASGITGLALAWSAVEKRNSGVIGSRDTGLVSDIVKPEPAISLPDETPLWKGFILGERSIKNLIGVHPDLVQIIEHAIVNAPYDFTVIEGLRNATRQKALLDAKASLTMNSKHLLQKDGFVHAVDIGYIHDGILDNQYNVYSELNDHFQEVANSLGLKLKWGGTFKRANGKPFVDAGHWELS